MKKWPVLVLLLLPAAPACGVAQESSYRVVRLDVQPVPESTPALRYRLLPELRDTHPGNAALLYYRSFSPEWLTHRRPEIAKKLAELDLKPGQAPPADFRWVLSANYLKEVDRAARRSYCDWEMTERAREEGIGLLLPDVQALREFARMLQMRARFQLYDGKIDDAHYTLQTGLMMGRHATNGPTLIQSLVGIAITSIMLGEVEEWIGRPGTPNLYWALTDLPRPFADLRRPLQGEKLLLYQLLPGLGDVASRERLEPLSPEQLRKVPPLFLQIAEGSGKGPSEWQVRLGYSVFVARVYPEARQGLIARGADPKKVDRLPMTQVVLLEELYNYERHYDAMAKWYGTTYSQARAGIALAEKDLRRLVGESRQLKVGGVLASLLLPAITKVVFASARLERHIDLLRCVEALRLYAAAHDGKLPARLEDVKEVPIPMDPVTGNPFEYRQEADQATLSAPPPVGEKPNMGNAVKYEIRLAK